MRVRSAQTLSRGRSGTLLRGVGAHAPCLLWCPLVVCSPRMRRQAGEHTVKRNSIFFPPMPLHRLFAGTPENHPYPSANPLVCLSRKSPFACPIQTLYSTASAENCRTFFFSLVSSFPHPPPIFFNFFFQFRSVAANVPHRMLFSRTSNPSRPSMSVNPSVRPVTRPADIIVGFSE
jgi:hypothetical protein